MYKRMDLGYGLMGGLNRISRIIGNGGEDIGR